jgi:hypothetical protein
MLKTVSAAHAHYSSVTRTMEGSSATPRKRQREEIDLTVTMVDPLKPVTDEVYYIRDADCILLVGNTLFKVGNISQPSSPMI